MKKKPRTPQESEIVAHVQAEMEKPRFAESVREGHFLNGQPKRLPQSPEKAARDLKYPPPSTE